MKIDDVSLTLFAWDDIPATSLRCIGAVAIALMGRERTAVLT